MPQNTGNKVPDVSNLLQDTHVLFECFSQCLSKTYIHLQSEVTIYFLFPLNQTTVKNSPDQLLFFLLLKLYFLKTAVLRCFLMSWISEPLLKIKACDSCKNQMTKSRSNKGFVHVSKYLHIRLLNSLFDISRKQRMQSGLGTLFIQVLKKE